MGKALKYDHTNECIINSCGNCYEGKLVLISLHIPVNPLVHEELCSSDITTSQDALLGNQSSHGASVGEFQRMCVMSKRKLGRQIASLASSATLAEALHLIWNKPKLGQHHPSNRMVGRNK